jgi:hypothetical protein
MYVNAKMIPDGTIPGMGDGRQRRVLDGVNSSMIYLIYCKNFCKFYNVPTPGTTTKKRRLQIQSLQKVLFTNEGDIDHFSIKKR